MTLNKIRNLVAAYLGTSIDSFTVNDEDLFLWAANSVRKEAELLHDFEAARVVANLTINGNLGGNIDDAEILNDPNGAFAGIKNIVALTRKSDDGRYVPLDFTRADIPIERDRTMLEFSDYLWPTTRYPSDAELLARGTAGTLIQRGRSLFMYPTFMDEAVDNTLGITIEGYAWLKDYDTIDEDAVDPEDFIVSYGFPWLRWAIIVELNTMFQKFVPRQEGNLPPPEAQRDAAWQRLLLWDSYQVDANVTRSR